jgi:dolichyl-phosphate beta-glucosyltransferase
MCKLTIVIPAFEEEQKIARDVEAAAAFLTSNRWDGEIIVVDDGSSDGTARVAREVPVPPGIHRAVVSISPHRGKGSAVRAGILAARGEYVLFADCGMTVPYDNALRGLPLLQEGICHLAHGSRELPESEIRRHRDPDRKIFSALFHVLVKRWLHLPASLTDTQCGFKLYRGDIARRLYSECQTDGFMFDIEIILRALSSGLAIREFPVQWTCDRDSRLGFRRNAGEIVRDLARLRRTLVRPHPPTRP